MPAPTNDLYNSWIEALESGNYPKTKHALRKTDGFCCLGVLCDTARSRIDWTAEYNSEGNLIYSFLGERAWLPSTLVKRLGFKPHNQRGDFAIDELSPALRLKVERLNTEYSLAAINDCTENFDLIIAVLKERPPSLFALQEGNI